MSAPTPAAASPPGEAAAGAAKAGKSANGAPFSLVFLLFTSCHSSTFCATSQCSTVGGAAGLTRVGHDSGTEDVQDHPGHAKAASQLQDRRHRLRCRCSVVIIIATAHSGLLVPCFGLSTITYGTFYLLECPRKPNLLSVGRLICRVLNFFSGGKTRQI